MGQKHVCYVPKANVHAIHSIIPLLVTGGWVEQFKFALLHVHYAGL
jgi:hypothetical protein